MMSTNENNTGADKKATDKIHATDLGETKDFNNLSFNKEKDSYELDVKGPDKDYDHPLPMRLRLQTAVMIILIMTRPILI